MFFNNDEHVFHTFSAHKVDGRATGYAGYAVLKVEPLLRFAWVARRSQAMPRPVRAERSKTRCGAPSPGASASNPGRRSHFPP